MEQKPKRSKSSPLVVDLLARTLEHQAKDEPSKLNRDRKLKDAQAYRAKHGQKPKPKPSRN
jgi:hypothetical protein